MQKLELNDLPRYSAKVRNILNNDLYNGRTIHKTPKEIKREYNDEKWRLVVDYIESNPRINIAEIEKKIYIGKEVLGCAEGQYCLEKDIIFYREQIKLYMQVLKTYLKNVNSLIELGAGYGAIILKLAQQMRKENVNVNYFAGEYTENGLKALELLSKRAGINIKTGKCDFFKLTADDIFKSASKPIIYTSYALMYIPELQSDFVEYILSLNPVMCVNFEPCYEAYDSDSIYGILCRKYIEVNDYNRNLVNILDEAQRKGRIEIVEKRNNVFGNNVLLPISVIAWRKRL
ncbi:hypothetical protein [Pectinatus frisingensis]|uniref:hypothetical protein n=1 Tax=Pectinatus frisingensis TaxID=865 RepID=UPI0018C60FEA|nr:hypothetical protein [Pectinatus frisingensis]